MILEESNIAPCDLAQVLAVTSSKNEELPNSCLLEANISELPALKMSENIEQSLKPKIVSDDLGKVYCPFCNLKYPLNAIGGQIVVRSLRLTILLNNGSFEPLRIRVPPRIPEEYHDVTTICRMCLKLNTLAIEQNVESVPKSPNATENEFVQSFQKKLPNEFNMMSKLPTSKRKAFEELPFIGSPKRPYPEVLLPGHVNDAIRNTPMHMKIKCQEKINNLDLGNIPRKLFK
jgi:hypothetical protein